MLSSKIIGLQKNKNSDFTLMFFPIDNLFHLIVNHDKEIYDLAFEKRIIFVGPSTLMAALKTISILWKEVGLSKNAEQIAEESGNYMISLPHLLKILLKFKSV